MRVLERDFGILTVNHIFCEFLMSCKSNKFSPHISTIKQKIELEALPFVLHFGKMMHIIIEVNNY